MARMLRTASMVSGTVFLALALLGHANGQSTGEEILNAAAAATPKYTLVAYDTKQKTCWDTCKTKDLMPELDTNFDANFWDDYGGDVSVQLPITLCSAKKGSTTFWGTANRPSMNAKTVVCTYLDNTGKNVTRTDFSCACNPTCKSTDGDCYFNKVIQAKWWDTSKTAKCDTKKCSKGCLCSLREPENGFRVFGYTDAAKPQACRAGGYPVTVKSTKNDVGFSKVCR